MSNIQSGDEQSEDGQIISPNSNEGLDFSLSDEYGNSLDIKPPQPNIRMDPNRRPDRRDRKRDRERRRETRRDRERRRHHREKNTDRDQHKERRRIETTTKDRRSESIQHSQDRTRHSRTRDRERDREIPRETREKSNADRVLEDLRSRLLNKRSRYHRSKDGEVDNLGKKISRSNISSKEKTIVIKDKRDLEIEARREKLLEAEREMARRKESSRAELEARREMRREMLGAKKRSSSPQRSQSPEIVRKRLRNASRESMERGIESNNDGVVTVSDNSEEAEEDDDKNQEYLSEGERTATDSEPSSASEHKPDVSEIESAEEASSPLSVGELAKSEPNTPDTRSRSQSRTPSPASSRSPPRSSHSASRSRTKSGSTSPPASSVKLELLPPEDIPSPPNKLDLLPPYFPGVQGCRSVEEFQCLNRIEEGTYGVVYRARDKRTEEIVALKRLKMEKEKEGFPITALREINTLLKAQHPNMVTVREIVVGSNMDKIFIVMDYVEHDLKSLMETMRHKKQVFLPGEVKCLTQQLLKAVAHLHDNWILHRDLKTSNLLLSHKGILKVGDFGLAREYGSPLRAYTPVVVTLWYRSPELLLCCKEYSTAVDMWSVGCIFAELLSMTALFPGKSEVDQLNRIFKDLGTPNEKIWPGYNNLPAVQKMTFTEYPVSSLNKRFGAMLSETGLNILNGFLTYDPKQRLTADDALKHNYFKEQPLPIDPAMFPTWPAKSELGTRRALASSPKPPSGGDQFKALGHGDGADESLGFHWGSVPSSSTSLLESRKLAMGAGFSLKF